MYKIINLYIFKKMKEQYLKILNFLKNNCYTTKDLQFTKIKMNCSSSFIFIIIFKTYFE